jgi:Uncharacterized conserved protein
LASIITYSARYPPLGNDAGNLQRSSRASQTPGLQKNIDDSVDVYFAPDALSGKDCNWIPTKANGQFEMLFRFYGPEKPLFDKTWSYRISRKYNRQNASFFDTTW